MIYSAGCEYAIRALTYLAASRPAGEYCLLRDILENDDLPPHFMGKILQDLVKAGLLASAKGRGGGFALQRPPKAIRMVDIINAMDGKHRLDRCMVGLAECDNNQPCALHEIWKGVREELNALVENTTLEDMVAAWNQKRRALGLDQKRSARSRSSKNNG